ncbi:MAG: CBS domain-containing protein [Acidobacteria bacterium]|nr:CBS domain-containing protein [Acidobacteriota bacterium]
MNTIRQLLQTKGHDLWSARPDTSVYDALQLMDEHSIGALLVLDGDDLVGIFSERDYARKVVLKGKTSRGTNVEEIMSRRVSCVRTDQTIEECMALMTDKHIRHLPVLEDDKLVGVISIGDVVKAVISEQEFVIEQLENYITGIR